MGCLIGVSNQLPVGTPSLHTQPWYLPEVVLLCCSDALVVGFSSVSTVSALLAVGAVRERSSCLELMVSGTAMVSEGGQDVPCPWLRRVALGGTRQRKSCSTAAKPSCAGESTRHRILEIRSTCSAPPQGFCSLQPSHNHRDVRADHGPQEAKRHPKPWMCLSREEQPVCKAGPRQRSLNHRLIRPWDSIWHL